MYNAVKIQINHQHPLFSYCEDITFKAKNLYNITNYYIRQVYTGLKAENVKDNQIQALAELESNLEKMNIVRYQSHAKKLKKAQEKGQEEPELKLFEMPTSDKPYLTFMYMDALFKVTSQIDYRAMPSQANQQVMKKVFDDWKGFFAALKEYKKAPSKFSGRPRMPKYKKKTGRTTCALTNQIVKIIDKQYLRLPQTKQLLNLGKVAQSKGKVQQVRIVPAYGQYTIEVIFKGENTDALQRGKGEQNTFLFEPKRVMGVDLGVDNLATISDNSGFQPVLIKGKNLKSINQYYNKLRSKHVGIIRNGKQKGEGVYSTKRLTQLDRKRQNRVMDGLHKASRHIVDVAIERKIDTIIIGKNIGWKSKVDINKKDKQSFIQLPHSTLIEMVRYKAEKLGIQVVDREESYTSKSCLLSNDEIPTYGEKHNQIFSGYRETRAFYKVKGSIIRIHADAHAAFNIIRKHVPKALTHSNKTAFLTAPSSVYLK